MSNGRKLGRGLDSLIRKSVLAPIEAGTSSEEVQRIDPSLISVNRAQPRRHFDEASIAELALSIQRNGILQPLVVRPHEEGAYELVAGERRLRAAKTLQLPTVPAIVRDLETENLLELALIENIQREDLNPIEEASAYRALLEQHTWTQSTLAERLGKKRSSIANVLRYLDLPGLIQESLAAGTISAGHAKVLLSIDGEELQIELHAVTVREGLSVRALEDRIRGPRPDEPEPDSGVATSSRAARAPGTKVKAPHIAEQEELLARALGTKVEIREGRERGRIIIDFYSTDDYERVRARLLGKDGPG